MWSTKEVQDGTWTGNPTKNASALIKSQQSTANLAPALTKHSSGGRIKHTAIKRRGKKSNRKASKMKTTMTLVDHIMVVK
jgi:hypothetical protein